MNEVKMRRGGPRALRVVTLLLAVAVSLLAAGHRFNDGAHASGTLRAEGGRARNPVQLESGEDRYLVLCSARVAAPYRGDVKVALRGWPHLQPDYRLSRPVVAMPGRRYPTLEGDIIRDVRAGDHLALWLVLEPPAVDPICGMAVEEGWSSAIYRGREYYFCADVCRETFLSDPEGNREADRLTGDYTVVFSDAASGGELFTVPLTFQGKGEAAHGGACEH